MKILLLSGVLLALSSVSAASAQNIGMTHILDLTANDAGKVLNVNAGDLLRVSLDNSAGTGYTWRALEVDPAYLTLIDKASAAPAKPAGKPPLVGGPGPLTIYTYYVRRSLNLGSYSVTTPLIFVNVPPGRGSGRSVALVQFDLTSK
ncbi:protease inhibitor I42 family protein [Deinococcus sp.]|uniref:protease inhibitor I42 family protein n=1 Tax=Deinococcus sp. TaxID=47478 RepID=UPI003CC5526C